jgi:hypothetical protein
MEPSGSQVGCFHMFSHQNPASIYHLLSLVLQLQLACFINLHLHFPTSKPCTLKRMKLLFVTQQGMISTVTVDSHKLVLCFWLRCCVHSYMGAKRLTTYDPHKLHLLALYTANCSPLHHFNITDFECLKYHFHFPLNPCNSKNSSYTYPQSNSNCAQGPNSLLPSLLIQHIHSYLPYTEAVWFTVSVKQALWVKSYLPSASENWKGS